MDISNVQDGRTLVGDIGLSGSKCRPTEVLPVRCFPLPLSSSLTPCTSSNRV